MRLLCDTIRFEVTYRGNPELDNFDSVVHSFYRARGGAGWVESDRAHRTIFHITPSWLCGIQVFFSRPGLMFVEYSAHKLLLGANGVYPASNYSPMGSWVLRGLSVVRRVLGVSFSLNDCVLKRIDVGALFRFPLWGKFFAQSTRGYYPRRELVPYPTSVATGSPRSLTYDKFYAKHPEQDVPGHCSLEGQARNDYLESIIDICRLETSFRSSWLKTHNITNYTQITPAIINIIGEHMKKTLEHFTGSVGVYRGVEQVDAFLRRRPGLRLFRREYCIQGHLNLLRSYQDRGVESDFYRYLGLCRRHGIPLVIAADNADLLEVGQPWEIMEVA